MEKHGYGNCTRDLHAFFEWTEEIVSANNTAEFQAFATLVNSHLDNTTIAALGLATTPSIVGVDLMEEVFKEFWFNFLPGDFQVSCSILAL